MTRSIKDIYTDMINTSLDRGVVIRFSGDIQSIKNYTGDNQIVETQLLISMWGMLWSCVNRSQKTTSNEFYSTDVIYAYNSGWWSQTQTQSNERNEFVEDGYTDGSNRLAVGSGSSSGLGNKSKWFLDGVDFIKKEISDNPPVLIFEGKLYQSFPSRNIRDSFPYSELNDWFSGSFYSPNYKQPESLPDLNNWLDAFDSILSTITGGVFDVGNPRASKSYPNSITDVKYSDIITTETAFSNFFWFDDNTQESGVMVRQDLESSNVKKINGDNYRIEADVYSENRTVNGIVYSMTDAFSGLSFGATAKDVFDNVAAVADDKYSESRLYYRYRNNPTNDDEPVGQNFVGETLETNINITNAKTAGINTVDDFFNVQGENDYIVMRNVFIKKHISTEVVSRITEPWESDLYEIIQVDKTPSIIGVLYDVDEGLDIAISVPMPVYPFTDSDLSGDLTTALWFTELSVLGYDGIDLSELTIIDLEPPSL